MSEQYEGVPASELSDEELERQGVAAHSSRHWVFLHGTREQYETHTRRMLQLEREYLRRHPQRTWQGTDPDARPVTDLDEAKVRLLAAFAAAPGGRMNKLEAHQLARGIMPDARLVASLYKNDPPLLAVDGDDRVLTDDGRAWLAENSPTQ